jgi:hypothetical protein
VVIVDEDFMHEFLGAFANCRLRMQTLQYHLSMSDLRPESPPQSYRSSTCKSRHGQPIQFRSALAPQRTGGLKEEKLRSRNSTELQTRIRPVGSADALCGQFLTSC